MSNRRPPEHEPGKDLVPVSATNGHVRAPKYQNFFASFVTLTELFDEQITDFEDLCSAWRGRNQRVDFHHEGDDVAYAQDLWTRTREGAEQCLADLEQLRTIKWKSTEFYHPSADFLLWRIGEMLKAWPDRLSDEAAVNYAEYMAEHLVAKDLNVMIWESVFLEFEENKKTKPPSIAEVLELMGRHKRRWGRRLDAINQDQIQCGGEETVFALEFKHAVFKDAVLEYLDGHGYTELAAGVRDGELFEHYAAIEATARTEELLEHVAAMEVGSIVVNGQLTHPFAEAQRILTNKKHVVLEWDLLIKNAQRRLNHDKAFACTGCGAGYEERPSRCMICDSYTAVVPHAKWDAHIVCEQEELQAKLQRERQVVEDELQCKRERYEEEARVRALFEPYFQNWRTKRQSLQPIDSRSL